MKSFKAWLIIIIITSKFTAGHQITEEEKIQCQGYYNNYQHEQFLPACPIQYS